MCLNLTWAREDVEVTTNWSIVEDTNEELFCRIDNRMVSVSYVEEDIRSIRTLEIKIVFLIIEKSMQKVRVFLAQTGILAASSSIRELRR